MVEAYPLHWPIRQPRTPRAKRRKALFLSTLASSLIDIRQEVRRLGGRDLVVSSNLTLRIDGFPRSGQSMPEDGGVAVYFERQGKSLAFACDRFDRVEHNLRAIVKHLEALRGMERWGVGTLDQAFAGYQALPEDAGDGAPWWRVLGLEAHPKEWQELVDAYRAAAKKGHPDAGGSAEAFTRIQRAYEEGVRAMDMATAGRP